MIVKVPREGITKYELQYFYEAEVGERKNVRKITLSDSGQASVNGTNKDVSEIETDTEEPEEDDTTATADSEDIPETEQDDTNDEGADDGIELEQDDEDDSISDESDETDDQGNDGITTEPDDDEISAGDDSDVESTSDDSSEEQTDTAEGLRKRALFSRMRGLHDAIGKYIEKLNMMMAYSSDLIIGYRESCDALDELQNDIYDYMLIRFVNASYPESMLFYQRSLAAVGVILEDLEKIDISKENFNCKQKQSTKQGKTSNKK